MKTTKASTRSIKPVLIALLLLMLAIAGAFALSYVDIPGLTSVTYSGSATTTPSLPLKPIIPPLNVTDYNARLLALAHVATSSPWYASFMQGATSTIVGTSTTAHRVTPLWPVQTALPTDSRALLPFNRIVAYYGNFYSTGMGVLGQYDEATVISKLHTEVAAWEAADPTTPVVPAIEYIDVTAQGSAGKDGKYRARMPDTQVDKALAMAKQVNGIVILDIQVGLSTLEDELPLLDTYWAMPNVHLAIDPEFSMKDGVKPGDEIGTMNAADVNYAAQYLAKFVKEYNLPPKLLIVHRFTEEMVTGTKNIEPLPEVQIVMNMDGWGFPAKKINTYNAVIAPEPVEFTGLKLFYHNDLTQTPSRLLTTSEILNLTPAPIYIQYQ